MTIDEKARFARDAVEREQERRRLNEERDRKMQAGLEVQFQHVFRARDPVLKICALCQRRPATTRHHLYTRQKCRELREWSKYTSTVPACRPCHDAVHMILSNDALFYQYNTVQKLLTHPLIGKWVKHNADKLVDVPRPIWTRAQERKHRKKMRTLWYRLSEQAPGRFVLMTYKGGSQDLKRWSPAPVFVIVPMRCLKSAPVMECGQMVQSDMSFSSVW